MPEVFRSRGSSSSTSSAMSFNSTLTIFTTFLVLVIMTCVSLQNVCAADVTNLYQDTLHAMDNEKTRLAQPSYEDNDIVEVVTTKNIVFRDSLRSHLSRPGPVTLDMTVTRTLLAFSMMREKPKNGGVMRVLDVGGGAGFHYFVAKAAIFGKSEEGRSNGRRARSSSKKSPIEVEWRVVETPSMVKGAKAKGLEERGLRFFDNIRAAAQSLGTVDLLLASSSLQYFPDPIAALKEMIDVKARYVFITRTPLSLQGAMRNMQTSRLGDNGPGPLPSELSSLNRDITYPITYADKSDIEAVLRTRYHIVVQFQEERSSFGSDMERYDNYGYFCHLQ
jgi:putative methyltransferase (TIGR04325 family)